MSSEDEDDLPPGVIARPDGRRPAVVSLRDWVMWFGPLRLVGTAIAVVAVVIAGWWLIRAPAPPSEASLPFATATSSPTTESADVPAAAATDPVDSDASSGVPAPTASDELVVHVAGEVRRPGVYRLPGGSRVNDAIVQAGGFGRKADADALNLAALLTDGARIYVPKPGETPPVVPTGSAETTGDSTGSDPAGTDPSGAASGDDVLNLNEASIDELETLPGIGPVTAQAIIDHREEHGGFASVDELDDVTGIGPVTLDNVRQLVTV